MADEIDGNRLQTFIDRLTRLAEEKKGIADDEKEILAEAKSSGFEPKYIRKVLALLKLDPEKRKLEEAEFELYKAAVGLD